MKKTEYPKYWDEKIETMPREELKKLQGKLLQKTMKQAYKSDFYRKIFKEVGVEPGDIKKVEDLHKLPLMSKEDFRKSLEEYPPFGNYTCVPMEKIRHLHATGPGHADGFQILCPEDRGMAADPRTDPAAGD